MKKLFFAFVAVAALGFASSCKDCVDCSGVSGYSSKICKDDYTEVAGVTWESYKTILKAAGCK